jgi:hypothetical protein
MRLVGGDYTCVHGDSHFEKTLNYSTLAIFKE